MRHSQSDLPRHDNWASSVSHIQAMTGEDFELPKIHHHVNRKFKRALCHDVENSLVYVITVPEVQERELVHFLLTWGGMLWPCTPPS